MPLHVYKCEICGTRFEESLPFGAQVGLRPCRACGALAMKSWEADDVMAGAIPDIEPYYEEQLDKFITGRRGLKNAMHEIAVDSDGKVKPEWR
jgi:hypothetical protein